MLRRLHVLLCTISCCALTSSSNLKDLLSSRNSDSPSKVCPNHWIRQKLTSNLHLCYKPSVFIPKESLFNQLVFEYSSVKLGRAECEAQKTTLRSELEVLRAEKGRYIERWNQVVSISVVCPEGWVQHKAKCFKLYNETRVTYPQAKQGCHQLHARATLVTIHSEDEQKFLVDLVLNTWKLKFEPHFNGIWLDGLYLAKVFFWTDGSSVTYTNWAPGEPNNHAGVESYVQLVLSQNPGRQNFYNLWNDFPISGKQTAVCQTYAVVEH